ncbi:cytochrome c/c1 heme lyase-domain-containing protein [Phycomyces nitens]|nr:cytochrome c/c1 heme lyase-domain-containing protein [Phycomyces nitens]
MTPPPGCPMHEPKKETPPPGCPMHKSDTPVTDKLNELNMMPNLTQDQYADQTMELPTERTISSIPKAKGTESKWEYPSPQQFYNALRRKGWETPEEHVETMVDIHNFLNEEAWNEVLKWESNAKRIPICLVSRVDPRNCHQRPDGTLSLGKSSDYLAAPEEVPGVPVFHLDIRPAIDSPEAAFFRVKEAAKEKWAQWFSSPASNQTA